MAAVDLTDELVCSIHKDIYKDPVTLPCGHSFCRDCITKTFDHQDEDDHRCPECQQRFKRRPELIRNYRLHNMAEACTLSDRKETGIFCTFCDLSVPAEKFCLQCETFMCHKHVTRHNKEALGHTLLPPSTDLRKIKCPVHEKILEYYCKEDRCCICESCWVDGDHTRHQVEPLKKAVEHKKKKLMYKREKLRSMQEKSQRKIQSLQEHSSRAHEKMEVVSKRVNGQFQNFRNQLEILERRVLSEIIRQEEMVSRSNAHLIQRLEKKNDELSKRIEDVEKLMSINDSLMVLQDEELEKDDFCEVNHWEEATELEEARCEGDLRAAVDLKSALQNISNIVTSVEKGIYMYEPTNITLAAETICNNADISWDKDGARKPTPDGADYSMFLSMENFSFGRYYWAVKTSESGGWRVGVCDSSIARRGQESLIGDTDKSWCLYRYGNKIYARHDGKDVPVPHVASYDRLLVCLDYDEGRLSFYELNDPLRHLHTFNANFTSMLFAAFGLHSGKLYVATGMDIGCLLLG
ncbi:E3 ubiquitin-protein ligase TRIM39-like [Phyllobates terribilis]|uniref:E3 ubiquitin-protein ligase TRIM39-like n=1 Tax=Phyllobates terribilis TaxID=111132 RepID=UPI003CCAE9BB